MSRRYQSQKKPIRKAKRNQPTLKQSAESHPWLTSFEQQIELRCEEIRRKMEVHISAMKDAFEQCIQTIPPEVRSLPLDVFCREYGPDAKRILEQQMITPLRPSQIINRPMMKKRLELKRQQLDSPQALITLSLDKQHTLELDPGISPSIIRHLDTPNRIKMKEKIKHMKSQLDRLMQHME